MCIRDRLEHGGAPEKAVKSAFVSAIDAYLKQNGKYPKGATKINFNDVADSLVLVTSSFSTVTSYENQTKKAITNKFIQDAMTDFLRTSLEVYFIENKADADKIADQVLRNKQIQMCIRDSAKRRENRSNRRKIESTGGQRAFLCPLSRRGLRPSRSDGWTPAFARPFLRFGWHPPRRRAPV